MSSDWARNALKAALALPSLAGAAMRTRNTRPASGSSSQPMSSFLWALGVARILKITKL